MLKSGLPIADYIREYWYSYDKRYNDRVQKFTSSAFFQEFYLLKEEGGAVLLCCLQGPTMQDK